MNECSILKTSIFNFNKSAGRLNLKSSIYNRLVCPKERIEINIHPALPDGSSVDIKVFIVKHTDYLGPSKGGIRMMPNINLDEITGLAMEMTWKTALIGVPFGGGKSGICYDSRALSEDTKEIIIRSFTRGARRHIGPEIYIPAPDMGTNETDMGHIRDCLAYSAGVSITNGCFVTGKPVILGGILGRREATGKGVAYTIRAACEKLDIDLTKVRIAVQGFGNVGEVATMALARYGARIVAVSDISGGVYDELGLDIPSLSEHIKSVGGVAGFKGAVISNSELLTVDCDILVPAATQSQLTADNASKVKARIIAEGANAPTTPEADDIFDEMGIFIIPDILCNAGGVFVSYLEYTQETQREQMTLEMVERRLSQRMNERFNYVFNYGQKNKLPMRAAAMDIAVQEVTKAVISRGFRP